MKSTLKIVLMIIVGVILLGMAYLVYDYLKDHPHTISCEDGERQTVAFGDLQLKYSSNKISLEVQVMNKLKLRPEIDPKVLQTAYESTQNWDQFLKGLIVGFNGCAIGKADYAKILQRYQAVEAISKNLSQLLQKNPLTPQDGETAKRLIEQYASATRELVSPPTGK